MIEKPAYVTFSIINPGTQWHHGLKNFLKILIFYKRVISKLVVSKVLFSKYFADVIKNETKRLFAHTHEKYGLDKK